MTIDQSRAELEVCFIHLALGVTLFGLILVKIADIEGQKKTTKTLRGSIMVCLKINWLTITIQLTKTTTDHTGFTTFRLKYDFCHFNSVF